MSPRGVHSDQTRKQAIFTFCFSAQLLSEAAKLETHICRILITLGTHQLSV